MFVDSKELSEEARVWVYPSSRKFYSQEIDDLKSKLKEFANNWIEDEEALVSCELIHDRFVVFYVEENITITNAYLNEKVAFIIQLQETYEIELLDKMNVCFKQGEFIQYKDVKAFKKLLKNRAVSSKAIVFDNLVQTKYELKNYWEVPITESWYNRLL